MPNEPFDRQYTIIADTDHGNMQILAQLPSIMTRFAKEGGHDMFLEQPPAMQELFEKYRDGKITSEKVKSKSYSRIFTRDADKQKSGELLLEIFDAAIKNDIRLHCVDQPPRLPSYLNETFEAIGPVLKLPREERPAALEKLIQKMTSASIQSNQWPPRFNENRFREEVKAIDDFMVSSREDNRVIGDVIKKVSANGEKVLIYYGAGHDDEPKGIANELGREKTSTVILLESGVSPQAAGKIRTPTRGLQYYLYLIKTGDLIKMDSECLDKTHKPCQIILSKDKLMSERTDKQGLQLDALGSLLPSREIDIFRMSVLRER